MESISKSLLLILLFATLLTVSRAIAQPTFEIIVKTGDKVNSSGTDEYFLLRNPSISDNGYFGFQTTIRNGGSVSAAWAAGLPGDWTLMAEIGTSVPGINGIFEDGPSASLDYLQLADNHVAFYFGFSPTLGANFGGQISDIQLLSARGVEEYNKAPGTNGGYFISTRAFPVINNKGVVAFSSLLVSDYGDVTSSNNSAIWTGKPDNLKIIGRKGSTYPGINGQFGGGSWPLINNNDEVLFESSIAPAESYQKSAILYSNDAYYLIARGGSGAEGVNGDYRTIVKKALNNKGNIAYIASLEIGSGNITSDNNIGLWFGNKDGVKLIMQKGGTIPGLSESIKNEGITDFYLDDYNHIGFITSISGKKTILAGPIDDFAQVVQEGQQAPGTSATIQTIEHFEFKNGITFVQAKTSENKSGLWVYKSGQGYKVTYQGENIETKSGSILATNFNIFSRRLLSQVGEFIFTVNNPSNQYLIKGFIEPLFNGDPNANLATLTTSQGTLTPAFAAGTTAYTVSLPEGTTSVLQYLQPKRMQKRKWSLHKLLTSPAVQRNAPPLW
jgi:hypothetical protein